MSSSRPSQTWLESKFEQRPRAAIRMSSTASRCTMHGGGRRTSALGTALVARRSLLAGLAFVFRIQAAANPARRLQQNGRIVTRQHASSDQGETHEEDARLTLIFRAPETRSRRVPTRKQTH